MTTVSSLVASSGKGAMMRRLFLALVCVCSIGGRGFAVAAANENRGLRTEPEASSPSTTAATTTAARTLQSSTTTVRTGATESHKAKFQKHFLEDATGLEVAPFHKSRIADVKKDWISVVTQLSATPAKLRRLADVASRWDGYISAAIHIRAPKKATDLIATLDKVDAFRAEYSELFRGRVALHLVIDKRAGDGKDGNGMHPHNVLRNVAMDNAPTDRVLLLDVDFVPSAGSHGQLLRHLKAFRLEDQKRALVLPAFERKLDEGKDESSIELSDLPATKLELLGELLARPGDVVPFNDHHHPASQGSPTNLTRWYTAKDPYRTDFGLNFEPYYVVHKNTNLPPFWEHFSGFARNKLTWVEELAVAGYEFHVAPDCFLTHVNHGTEEKGERVLLPAMADEYTLKFQPYLKERYGESYLEQEGKLMKWLAAQKKRYAALHQ